MSRYNLHGRQDNWTTTVVYNNLTSTFSFHQLKLNSKNSAEMCIIYTLSHDLNLLQTLYLPAENILIPLRKLEKNINKRFYRCWLFNWMILLGFSKRNHSCLFLNRSLGNRNSDSWSRTIWKSLQKKFQTLGYFQRKRIKYHLNKVSNL